MFINTRAAALWVPNGIVAGRAAAAVHGAGFVDPETPIELIGGSRRHQDGVIVRNERIGSDEVGSIDGIAVCRVERTALDLARHLPRFQAVAHLDALAAAVGLDPLAVLDLAHRYPGARGIRRARVIVPLVDAGSQSPCESWLRMLVIDDGYPRPQTQIRVTDGVRTAYIDLGWPELKIGLEYDGNHHRSDRHQFVKDIGRYEMLADLGWLIIRVVKEHNRAYVLARVQEAFHRRLAKSA